MNSHLPSNYLCLRSQRRGIRGRKSVFNCTLDQGGIEPFSDGYPLTGAFRMLVLSVHVKTDLHLRLDTFVRSHLFSVYHRVSPKTKTKFSNSGEAQLVSVCVLYDLTLLHGVGNVKNFFQEKTLKLSLEGSKDGCRVTSLSTLGHPQTHSGYPARKRAWLYSW